MLAGANRGCRRILWAESVQVSASLAGPARRIVLAVRVDGRWPPAFATLVRRNGRWPPAFATPARRNGRWPPAFATPSRRNGHGPRFRDPRSVKRPRATSFRDRPSADFPAERRFLANRRPILSHEIAFWRTGGIFSAERSTCASSATDSPQGDRLPTGGERFRRELAIADDRVLQLSRIDDPTRRAFYELYSLKEGWSVRELQRQRDSMIYERVGLSENRDEVLALTNQGTVAPSITQRIDARR